MKFNIGDKVSFLNEKQQGVVVKVLGPDLVSVLIDAGFEIPVLKKELVRIDFTQDVLQDTDKKEQKQFHSSTPKQKILSDTQQDVGFKSPLNLTSQTDVLPGLYLCFSPVSESQFLSGMLHVYLINHTRNDVLYTLAYPEDGKLYWFNHGISYSMSKLLLDTLDNSQIDTWAETHIEMLFYREGNAVGHKPLVKDIKINPLRFYKEENYKQCSLTNSRAFLTEITSIPDEKNAPDEKISKKQEATIPEESSRNLFVSKINPEELPHHYIIDNGIAEIDLHIEELIDKIGSKTPTQLLDIQMNHFRRMLDKAIELHFKKIIFIHGVGNGRLRNSLRETLTHSYPKLKFQDAPMSRYGIGATEVIIPHNL